MDELTTEVPRIFYSCFIQAVLECCVQGYSVKIISDPLMEETNSYLIKVLAEKPEYFFHLGKKYATFRSEM